MDEYNGYSSRERAAKGAELRKALDAGVIPTPTGPCALCGDPGGDANEKPGFEIHSEDYSKPYRLTPPAAYVLCRHCHRNKLHKRFQNPEAWEIFKTHVRRGGYARHLKRPEVKRELEQYAEARRLGRPFDLVVLGPYPHVIGSEWWASLSSEKPTVNNTSRQESMPQENRNFSLILRIGADGGSIALYGYETDDGWIFRCHVSDQTPMFIGEDSIDHDSQTVTAWSAAIKLLDRYPWASLFPIYVHPSFGDRVWREVCKRATKRRPRGGELDVWLDACFRSEVAS